MISGVLRVEFSRWDFAVLLATSCEEADGYAAQTVAQPGRAGRRETAD